MNAKQRHRHAVGGLLLGPDEIKSERQVSQSPHGIGHDGQTPIDVEPPEKSTIGQLLRYTSACCGSRTNETASTMAIAVAMVANSQGSLGSRVYITPPANEANMRGSVTT